jgi:hypothetical protein
MNGNRNVGRESALGAAIYCGFDTTLPRLACDDSGTSPVSPTHSCTMSALLMAASVPLLRKS